MNQYNRYYFFLAFFLLTLIGCKKEDDSIGKPVKEYSGITKSILDNSGIVSQIFSDTTIRIGAGVEESEIHFLKMNGYTTRVYIMKVDLKAQGVRLKVSTPYDAPSFGGQTLPDMAKYLDKSGQRVLGGINGDYYDISNYVPRGVLHKNGIAIKKTFTSTEALNQQGLSFFGILDNGKPYIGYKEEYPAYANRLIEATGAGIVVMKDGRVVDNQQFSALDPRTAIGYTKEDVVYLIAVDGRDFYRSNGATYADLSAIMKSLGCESGTTLDGGGSTTMMIRNPLADVWQVRNNVSDGTTRAVSNGWLVVSDEK